MPARLLQFLALARGSIAFLANIVQQLVGAQIRGVDVFPRGGDDLLIEAKALSNEQGIGAARQADRQAIGRAECLDVKFKRCIDDARRAVREGLQLRVMRGHKCGDAALDQVAEDGAGDGGALLRVGAGAEFIQDDQRAGVGLSAGCG